MSRDFSGSDCRPGTLKDNHLVLESDIELPRFYLLTSKRPSLVNQVCMNLRVLYGSFDLEPGFDLPGKFRRQCESFSDLRKRHHDFSCKGEKGVMKTILDRAVQAHLREPGFRLNNDRCNDILLQRGTGEKFLQIRLDLTTGIARTCSSGCKIQ